VHILAIAALMISGGMLVLTSGAFLEGEWKCGILWLVLSLWGFLGGILALAR